MDSSYGLNRPNLKGSSPKQETAFVLAGSEFGKPVLIPVALPMDADALQLSGANHKKKKRVGILRAAADTVKGFGKGGVQTVSGLLSVKGLLMTAGTIGLCALAGPAVIPFLVAAGVFAGGAQIAKGAANGNWEGVGEGLFTLGASMAGAKFSPKLARNSAGEELSLISAAKAGQSNPKPGFLKGAVENMLNHLRLVFGGKVANSANPQSSANIYKLVSENAKNNWRTFKQQGVTLRESSAKFNASVDKIVQSNPKLQNALRNTLGTDGKVALNPTRTQSTNPQVRHAIQQFAGEQPIAWNLDNTLKSGSVFGTEITGKAKGWEGW